MSQGNLKKAILLQSHINFLQIIPLFSSNATGRNIFTPLTNNMKTQEKYPSRLWFPWEEIKSTSQHKGRWGEGNSHHSFADFSKICIQSEDIVHCFCHNSKTLIFRNPLLKEICFSFQRNILHEIKRIFCIKDLGKENTLVILTGK